MEGRRRPDRDRYSTDTGSFITRSSARNLWRHVGPLGSYRRKPFIGFFLHPFIPRAEVLCNLRRLWGLAAIKWSAVFGRVGPFSNAIRHKHLPRRYLWSQLTLLTRQGSSFWCRRLFGREWGDNDCRAGCGKGGRVGKHISVLIMCHSQSWEMLRKQSGELCELPSYQLCQLFSNVSRGKILTSLLGKWKQANFVGRGWVDGSHRWGGKANILRSGLHPTCYGFLIFSSSWWEWINVQKSSRRRVKQRCHPIVIHIYELIQIPSPLDIVNIPSER